MKRQIYTYLKFSLELRKYSALPKQASVNESAHAMMYRVQYVQKTRTGYSSWANVQMPNWISRLNEIVAHLLTFDC